MKAGSWAIGRVFALGVIVVLLGSPLLGQWQDRLDFEEEQVEIDAEKISYDRKIQLLTAEGDVRITHGETTLSADRIEVQENGDEATAVGNVLLIDPAARISADRVLLNLKEETGTLEGASIESERYPHSVSGRLIEKKLGQCYRIYDGEFTTCRCPDGPPSWSIRTKEMEIDISGLGKLRGATFNVMDVPVFYLPRAVFPISLHRQSGFLTPSFGLSNTRGFQVLMPYYWAINKSHDATIGFDAESSARVGLVTEYRYALSQQTNGRLNVSYFNETIRGDAPPTVSQDRWSVDGRHQQSIPFLGMELYADGLLVSDDLFLREINTFTFDHQGAVSIRTLPYTAGRAGFYRPWERFFLRGEVKFYQDLTDLRPVLSSISDPQPTPTPNLGGLVGVPLVAEDPRDSAIVQRAPQIQLEGQSQLWGPLLANIDLGIDHFTRSRGTTGLRLDLNPKLSLALPFGRFTYGGVHLGFRETAYYLLEDTLPDESRSLPENKSREMFELRADIGTALSRVFRVDSFGLKKIRHTVEPKLEYLFVPNVGQRETPFFEGSDRINRRNRLTLGIVNRFFGKFSADFEGDESEGQAQNEGVVRELGRLWLAQTIDFSEDIAPPRHEPDRFSDIDLGGRVNPSDIFSVRFTTNYDPAASRFSAATIGFFAQDTREQSANPLGTRTSASISYRFLTQSVLAQAVDDDLRIDRDVVKLQLLDTSLALRLTNWLGFGYSARYDLQTNQFLDNHFSFRLTSSCNCWSLDVGVSDRSNPQEVETRVQLNLVGLSNQSRALAATQP